MEMYTGNNFFFDFINFVRIHFEYLILSANCAVHQNFAGMSTERLISTLYFYATFWCGFLAPSIILVLGGGLKTGKTGIGFAGFIS